MTPAVYVAAVVLFSLTFIYAGVVRTCSDAVKLFLQSIEVVADHTLEDRTKELAVQRAALGALRKLVLLLLKIVLVFFATALPFWAGDFLGIASYEQTIDFATRWDVLAVTTVVAVLCWLVHKKLVKPKERSTASTPSNDLPYGDLDRVIHNFSFGSRTLRKTMLAAEEFLFGRKWAGIAVQKPVFITSLPRAGTTILLNALSTLPPVATHTYRDMPFVLSPLLWSKLSGSFQKRSAHTQRAHGDGITINEDSPEAFEEVLWLSFFRHKYADNRIALWNKPDTGFTGFFSDHMRKIILLRQSRERKCSRYVSKNNANIARIPALLGMYPDAVVLVPVRNPLEHAISMLRQHTKFADRQSEQQFVRKYMGDIGHFEFGELHYPIQFPGLEQLIAGLEPDSCDYWLAYWIAAFEHLATIENIHFLSYEWLASSGEAGFSAVCRTLELEASDESMGIAAGLFNKVTGTRSADFTFNPDFESRAMSIYSDVIARAAEESLA